MKNGSVIGFVVIFVLFGAGLFLTVQSVKFQSVPLGVADMEPLAPISLVALTVRVRNAGGYGIAGAVIQLDLTGGIFPPGDVDYTLITNSLGNAERTIVQGTYYITIMKPGYIGVYDDGPHRFIYDSPQQSITLTYVLESGTDPDIPTGKTVDFYLVAPNKARIVAGQVIYDGREYTTATNGLIRIYGVPQGLQSFRISGRYQTGLFNWEVFDFEAGLDIEVFGNVFTVWAETETVTRELPPAPPIDWMDHLPLILGVGGLIVFLAIFFPGVGTELVKKQLQK